MSVLQRFGEDRAYKAVVQVALDLTGSIKNRSLEAIKGGSSTTDGEVCCSSNISRKRPIAFVMFSLNFAPA